MEDFEGMLWALVHKHIKSNNYDLEGELERTKEDLFSVARKAALVAVAKYRSDKGAALATWIYRCVENALIDSNKYKKNSLFIPRKPDEFFASCEESYTLDDIEFNLTMQQLLSPELYRIYFMRIVEDRTENEISNALGISRRQVRKCLQLISQKYLLLETSHQEVLTTRRRQDNWLNSSSPSQSEL